MRSGTHGLLSKGCRGWKRHSPVNRRFPKCSRSTHRPVPSHNIHEKLDVRGGFFICTQVPHDHRRRFRVGNHHRDDVTVFRSEVSDHHVEVHDIRVEVPVSARPWCLMVTAEFPSSLDKGGFEVRCLRGMAHRKSKRRESMGSRCPNFF